MAAEDMNEDVQSMLAALPNIELAAILFGSSRLSSKCRMVVYSTSNLWLNFIALI